MITVSSGVLDFVDRRASYYLLFLESVVYFDHVVGNGCHLEKMLLNIHNGLLLRDLHLVHVGEHGRYQVPVLLYVVDALLQFLKRQLHFLLFSQKQIHLPDEFFVRCQALRAKSFIELLQSLLG